MQKTEMLPRVKKHEIWIDSIKLFACILVVAGHFFMSMEAAGIISNTDIYAWFIKTIYYFHVPLFFVCSGYLFQKYSTVDSMKSWGRNIAKKAVGLGIPYIVFSTVTWVLKFAFSGSVNDEVKSNLLYTLVLDPISPYWYLYCLFFIFLVTPTFRTKKAMGIGIGAALLMKLVAVFERTPEIYMISVVCENEIWFVLGMCLAKLGFRKMQLKYQGVRAVIGMIAFLGLSIYVYHAKIWFWGIEFLMGLFACLVVVEAFSCFTKRETPGKYFAFLAKSTLPIYLLHTIFAACFRTVLIKLNIYHTGIHILGGLVISFAGPMFVTMIMKKIKVINFLIYPQQYIRIN